VHFPVRELHRHADRRSWSRKLREPMEVRHQPVVGDTAWCVWRERIDAERSATAPGASGPDRRSRCRSSESQVSAQVVGRASSAMRPRCVKVVMRWLLRVEGRKRAPIKGSITAWRLLAPLAVTGRSGPPIGPLPIPSRTLGLCAKRRESTQEYSGYLGPAATTDRH